MATILQPIQPIGVSPTSREDPVRRIRLPPSGPTVAPGRLTGPSGAMQADPRIPQATAPEPPPSPADDVTGPKGPPTPEAAAEAATEPAPAPAGDPLLKDYSPLGNLATPLPDNQLPPEPSPRMLEMGLTVFGANDIGFDVNGAMIGADGKPVQIGKEPAKMINVRPVDGPVPPELASPVSLSRRFPTTVFAGATPEQQQQAVDVRNAGAAAVQAVRDALFKPVHPFRYPEGTALRARQDAEAAARAAQPKFGYMTPEESAAARKEALDTTVATIGRIQTTTASVEAMFERRRRLWGDARTDFEIKTLRERATASIQEAVTEAIKLRVKLLTDPSAPKETWWMNAIETAAKSFAQTGTSFLKMPAVVAEALGQTIDDAALALKQRAGQVGDRIDGEQPAKRVATTKIGDWTGAPSTYRAFVEGFDKFLTDNLPGDAERSKEFVTTLAAAGGSMIGFTVAGLATRAAGMSLYAGAAITGAATQAVSQFEDAERFNATGFQKLVSIMIGAGLGMTEAIQIDRMFLRAEQATGGGISRLLKNSAASSLEEFIQEFGQNYGADLAAKLFPGYDPNRQIDIKEISKQALAAGIMGGATSVAVQTMGPTGPTSEDVFAAIDQRLGASAETVTSQLTDAGKTMAEVEKVLGPEALGPDGAAARAEFAEAWKATIVQPAELAATAHVPQATVVTHDGAVEATDGAPLAERPITPEIEYNIAPRPAALLADPPVDVALPVGSQPAAALAAGGLSFPAEVTAPRLARFINREEALRAGEPMPGAPVNPRTVIKAAEGSGLPDFVVGDITVQDWRQRTEAILAPDEISAAAGWYETLQDVIQLHIPNPAEAQTFLMAWLVGQQNTDVNGALNNVMLQAEQLARGVPPEEMALGGLGNPTRAIRAVLQGMEIPNGTVGQKIADFVDAAIGKKVRSIMGNDERGGAPFVVDVQTARDTGMVDQELLNHLSRLGYKVPKRVKAEFGVGSMPETKYENRGRFGRQMTEQLNRAGWMGRSDWKPHEVQAVGWMAMQKMLSGANKTLAQALQQITRRIAMELEPGAGAPLDKRFGDQYRGLPLDAQQRVTGTVAGEAIRVASEISGINLRGIVAGIGGWDLNQNAAAVASVMATDAGAELAAASLGYLLQQTEVWVNRIKERTKNPKALAVDITVHPDDASGLLSTPEGIRHVFDAVRKADATQTFVGFQPFRDADGSFGLRILVDGAHKKLKGQRLVDLIEAQVKPGGSVAVALEALEPDLGVRLNEADITKVRNDWKEQPDGQGYLSRVQKLGGKRAAASLVAARDRIEKAFGDALAVNGAGGPVDFNFGPQGDAGAAGGNAAAAPGAAEGEIPGSGQLRGGAGGSSARLEANTPLAGLPTKVWLTADRQITVGPSAAARRLADRYMREEGLPYAPPATYVKVSPDRAVRIAQAYDEMVHAPQDPLVVRAYRRMIDETIRQWEYIKTTGLQVEFSAAGYEKAYGENPRLAMLDIQQNNHLWVYPTDAGFGSSAADVSGNPLLEKTGEVIGGYALTANDVFRIVHDYFGHYKEGLGFRADGEENAWRSHAAMYSPLARWAMTSETRGQNSWVNFGPLGPQNRKASQADTVYADQKTGLLPDWAVEEGRGDAVAAHHGSPHSFDRFSMEAIGTGEGAQVYGHGLYFAESKSVAESYRDGLARNGPQHIYSYDGIEVREATLATMLADDAAVRLGQGSSSMDVRTAAANIIHDLRYGAYRAADLRARWAKDIANAGPRRIAAAYTAVIDVAEAKGIAYVEERPGGGRLYSVRIAINPDMMLDYDLPLSQQAPAVREALRKLDIDVDVQALNKFDAALLAALTGDATTALPRQPADPEGAAIMKAMRGAFSGADAATRALKDVGIPGLKYRDQGSRGRAQKPGTRNFVVFDDSLIQITHVDGKPVGPAVENVLPPGSKSIVAYTTTDPRGVEQQQGKKPSPPAGNLIGSPQRQPVASGFGPSEQQLTEIGKALRRALKLVVRQGRLTHGGALGQYNRSSTVIRLKNWADFESLAHEVGHFLHDQRSQVVNRLVNSHATAFAELADKVYGGDLTSMSRDQINREGFAEFFRLWMTNPTYQFHGAEPANLLGTLSMIETAAKKNPGDANLQAQLAAAQQAIVDSRANVRHLYEGAQASFEQLFAREAPEVLKALEGIRAAYRAWLEQPSLQFIRSSIVSQKRPTGIIGKLNHWIDEHGGTLGSAVDDWIATQYQSAINGQAALRRMSYELLNLAERNGQPIDLKAAEHPYILAMLEKGGYGAGMMNLTDGVRPYQGVDPSSPSLRDAILVSQGMKPGRLGRPRFNQVTMADFNAYLVARRARQEYIRYETGELDRPPIRATKGDVDQSIKDLEARYPHFDRAAQMVYDYWRALWRKKFDAGLITQETFDLGATKLDHVPLMRDMADKKKAKQIGAGATLSGRAAKVYRFIGSDRDIIAPLEAMAEYTFALEKAIARNDVRKTLASLAERSGRGHGALVEEIPATQLVASEFPVLEMMDKVLRELDPADAAEMQLMLEAAYDSGATLSTWRKKTIKPGDERIVLYFRDGKPAAFQLSDDQIGADVMDALTSLGQENMPLFTDLIALPASIVRSTITGWPDFIAVNFIRDQIAYFITQEGYIPGVSGLKGTLAELFNTKVAKAANSFGMIMGGMNTASVDEARITRDIDALRGRGYRAQVVGDLGSIRNGNFRAVAGALGRATELTETGSRLGAFSIAYKRAIRDGLTPFEAMTEAAWTATDALNFSQKGSRMVMLGRLIPFLRAQINGLDKAFRTLTAEEFRGRKGWLKTMQVMVGLKSKAGYMSRREQAAVRIARKAWVKMTLIGLLGAALQNLFKDDEDYQEASEYLRQTGWIIPLGKGELLYIPKPFELGLLSNAFERGLEHDGKSWERFWRGAWKSLMPTTEIPVIAFTIEAMMNKDFFTGQDIVPDYMQRLAPQYQFTARTSEIAKAIAKATADTPFPQSPMMVDFFLSSFFTSAARDILAATNPLFNPNRPSGEVSDAFIARRFIRDVTRGDQAATDFWELANRTNGTFTRAADTYDYLLQAGNEVEARQRLAEMPADERAYATVMQYAVEYKRLHPMYREQALSGTLSAMRREVQAGAGVLDGVAGKPILLTAKEARAVDNALSDIARREMRNTMVALGLPGWAGKQMMDTDTSYELLAAVNPEIAAELQRRVEKAKVYDADTVFAGYPELRQRLLGDGLEAYLADLLPGKAPKRATKKRPGQ